MTTQFPGKLHNMNTTKKDTLFYSVAYLRDEHPFAYKKGLNRISKIGNGHLCLWEVNLTFIDNYIIQAMLSSILNISKINVSRGHTITHII